MAGQRCACQASAATPAVQGKPPSEQPGRGGAIRQPDGDERRKGRGGDEPCEDPAADAMEQNHTGIEPMINAVRNGMPVRVRAEASRSWLSGISAVIAAVV